MNSNSKGEWGGVRMMWTKEIEMARSRSIFGLRCFDVSGKLVDALNERIRFFVKFIWTLFQTLSPRFLKIHCFEIELLWRIPAWLNNVSNKRWRNVRVRIMCIYIYSYARLSVCMRWATHPAGANPNCHRQHSWVIAVLKITCTFTERRLTHSNYIAGCNSGASHKNQTHARTHNAHAFRPFMNHQSKCWYILL